MKSKLYLMAPLMTLMALSSFVVAQESQLELQIEQAKQLSALTGRPILAVAGEAAN